MWGLRLDSENPPTPPHLPSLQGTHTPHTPHSTLQTQPLYSPLSCTSLLSTLRSLIRIPLHCTPLHLPVSTLHCQPQNFQNKWTFLHSQALLPRNTKPCTRRSWTWLAAKPKDFQQKWTILYGRALSPCATKPCSRRSWTWLAPRPKDFQ